MNDYNALMEFLKPFSEGNDGYIGFTKANRSDDPELNKKWGTFHNWYAECAAGEVDLPREILDENPNWEYYFTPAVLTEESRLQSKFQHSNVIWIDFDEPVEWMNFDPSPSIVVQTSEKKFHCYWLLDWQITSANDQRYWCKRFLEYFHGGDLSGFDATQLLKLPWGANLKLGSRNEDGTPWTPRVIKFVPDLKYAETAFAGMPEPSVSLVDTVDMSALPDLPDSQGGWQYYLDMHRNSLPQLIVERVQSSQDGGAEKRSGALYNLECELFDVLGNPEDVFHILLGSPNDKFSADHGSRGASLLWKDVNRVAVKQQKSKATPAVAAGLRDILGNKKIDPGQKTLDGTAYVIDKLKETGQFIRTVRGECFYIDKRSEVITLYKVSEKRFNPFTSMVRRRFGLNEGVHSKMIVGILGVAFDDCMQQAPIKFHNFAYYDERRNLVYVDRYDGYMYVLNGTTSELYPHGHDGVFFYQNAGSEFPRPFELVDSYTSGSLDALILDGPNYTTAGMGITRREIRHLIKTWVVGFFFPSRMATRPLLLMQGVHDTGKSTIFQCLSLLFTGDDTYAVQRPPKNNKQFSVSVTQNSYVFYDDISKFKDLQEEFSQAATGYTDRDRILFSDNDQLEEKARCFIGITTNVLDKIENRVASRSIPIFTHAWAAQGNFVRMPQNKIFKNVLATRNELWSELIDLVNKILEQVLRHGWPEAPTELRMADYGNLLATTSSLEGLSPTKIERFILKMQTEIMSENDSLFPALQKLIDNPTHDVSKRYESKQLYDAVSRVHRKLLHQYDTSNKFTRALTGHVDSGALERAGISVQIHMSGKNKLFSVGLVE